MGLTTISGIEFYDGIFVYSHFVYGIKPMCLSIEDGHVIPGLIHKTYLAKQNGNSFVHSIYAYSRVGITSAVCECFVCLFHAFVCLLFVCLCVCCLFV